MSDKKYTKEYIDNYFRMVSGNDDTDTIFDYFRQEHGVTIRYCAPPFSGILEKAYRDGIKRFDDILALRRKFGPKFIELPENDKIKLISQWIEAVNAGSDATKVINKHQRFGGMPEIEITHNNETEIVGDMCQALNYLFEAFTPEYEAAQKKLTATNERG